MISTFVIAVTGGIGSGKSTVCKLFEQRHGVPVIDADVIAREVVEPGEPALDLLVVRFGQDILAADGTLDRAALKRRVFADEAERRALETILHPRIRRRMDERLAAIRTPYCLLGIPLLTADSRHDNVDRILVVDCPEEVQIARVRQRDDLTEAEVIAIMRTQASRASRRALADDIVMNNGSEADLIDRIDKLHEIYLGLAREKASGQAARGH
ncbi:MAG: dephospho-CoA kinase [Gammaproteobacteria bacterium]